MINIAVINNKQLHWEVEKNLSNINIMCPPMSTTTF